MKSKKIVRSESDANPVEIYRQKFDDREITNTNPN